MSDTTRQRLAAILVPQASLANPIDVAGTSDSDPAVLAKCMEIVAEDDGVDTIFLVGMFGGYYLRFAEDLLGGEMRGAESMIELWRKCRKPLVIYSLYEAIRPPALRRLHEAGLPVYASLENAVRVIAALGERGIYLAASDEKRNVPAATPIQQMQAHFATARSEGRDLFEYEAKALLRAHGVDIQEELVAHSADELDPIAERFGDQPLVMKVVSKDILHKSDAGGVKLNLVGEQALHKAFDRIMASCRDYAPEADINGVLVTPMARRGLEVIIGVMRDPIFGPVLMFGLGGIFVEILKDVTFRAIPLSRYDARSMVEQIKANKVLRGVRGEAAVDKEALVDLLLKISSIVEAYPELAELDLNPVILYDDGYAVVDARVIVDRPGAERKGGH